MVLTTQRKPTSKILLYLLPEKNLIDMQPWHGHTFGQQNAARFPTRPSPGPTGWNKVVLHNHLDHSSEPITGIRTSYLAVFTISQNQRLLLLVSAFPPHGRKLTVGNLILPTGEYIHIPPRIYSLLKNATFLGGVFFLRFWQGPADASPRGIRPRAKSDCRPLVS